MKDAELTQIVSEYFESTDKFDSLGCKMDISSPKQALFLAASFMYRSGFSSDERNTYNKWEGKYNKWEGNIITFPCGIFNGKIKFTSEGLNHRGEHASVHIPWICRKSKPKARENLELLTLHGLCLLYDSLAYFTQFPYDSLSQYQKEMLPELSKVRW